MIDYADYADFADYQSPFYDVNNQNKLPGYDYANYQQHINIQNKLPGYDYANYQQHVNIQNKLPGSDYADYAWDQPWEWLPNQLIQIKSKLPGHPLLEYTVKVFRGRSRFERDISDLYAGVCIDRYKIGPGAVALVQVMTPPHPLYYDDYEREYECTWRGKKGDMAATTFEVVPRNNQDGCEIVRKENWNNRCDLWNLGDIQ